MTAEAKEGYLFPVEPATPGNDQHIFPAGGSITGLFIAATARCIPGSPQPRCQLRRHLSVEPRILHPAPKIKLKIYLFDDKSIEVEGMRLTKSRGQPSRGDHFDNTNSETRVILQYALNSKKDDRALV